MRMEDGCECADAAEHRPGRWLDVGTVSLWLQWHENMTIFSMQLKSVSQQPCILFLSSQKWKNIQVLISQSHIWAQKAKASWTLLNSLHSKKCIKHSTSCLEYLTFTNAFHAYDMNTLSLSVNLMQLYDWTKTQNVATNKCFCIGEVQPRHRLSSNLSSLVCQQDCTSPVDPKHVQTGAPLQWQT